MTELTAFPNLVVPRQMQCMRVLWTVISLCLLHVVVTTRQDLQLVVHGESESIPFNHFWQSTGFCPPLPHQSAHTFDLSPDMEQNLAYVGSVPHHGIQQVRIHWLLDLIKVQSFSSGQPVYNFTDLDAMMGLLYVNRLQPGFELMGSPSGIYTDMENKTQVFLFRDLVKQLALRYISVFGLDEVKMWNFETWNEPDCHDFDDLKMTVQGFLNYYDACSEGLMAASPVLLFGGPGDGCDTVWEKQQKVERDSKYAEALFDHVVNGTNFFTGRRGVRMDFISLHRKGDGKSKNILDKELASMADISRRWPSLANKPFYNDEADPLVGWSKDEPWRATAQYAAMVVKVIGQHQNLLIGPGGSPLKYALLSNDNAFLSYHPHPFTQRTLLARFQMNFTAAKHNDNTLASSTATNNSYYYNTLTSTTKKSTKYDNSKNNVKYDNSVNTTDKNNNRRERVKRDKEGRSYVTFVRKPIHAAMVLLAKLGDRQVPSQVFDSVSRKPLPNDSYAGSIATVHIPRHGNSSDSFQWAVMVYFSADTSQPTKHGILQFDWKIKPLNATDLVLAVYTINDRVTNPFHIWWDTCGKPDFPSLKQFALIRKSEGPLRLHLVPVTTDHQGIVSVPSLKVQEPEVLLLHLCQKSLSPPEQVTGVRLINITAGQVMILWSDDNINTKCIKTFEVEHAGKATEDRYKQINTDDTIVNLFVHATDSETLVEGIYRVRGVDYWLRPGPYSSPVRYS